jgi:hypothetical protein
MALAQLAEMEEVFARPLPTALPAGHGLDSMKAQVKAMERMLLAYRTDVVGRQQVLLTASAEIVGESPKAVLIAHRQDIHAHQLAISASHMRYEAAIREMLAPIEAFARTNPGRTPGERKLLRKLNAAAISAHEGYIEVMNAYRRFLATELLLQVDGKLRELAKGTTAALAYKDLRDRYPNVADRLAQ